VVLEIRETHPRAEPDDIIICRRERSQRGIPRNVSVKHSSVVFLRGDRWHAVRPGKETPGVTRFVLTFFQRALAWDVAQCSEVTYNGVGSLGKMALRSDPAGYARESLDIDSRIQKLIMSNTLGLRDEP
jgi:hypothetical protein